MPQYSYDELSQMLANAQKQSTPMSPAQLDAIYGPDKPASKPGALSELGKATGRGVLGIPKLATGAAAGLALTGGKLLGVKPEDNAVYNAAQQGTQAIEDVQQGETLAPNQEYAEEHPVMNWVNKGLVEGGIPWMGAAALTRIPGMAGRLALPAVATLGSQAEGTRRGMKEGVSGDEAYNRSLPGSLAEGAAFYAMHPVMQKLKGAINPESIEGVTKGILPGALGKPGGNILTRVAQGAITDAPYLYGQGELKQGVDVAAGAISPEQWKQQHTPEAITEALGSSLIGGIGFGVLGGIGQKDMIERIHKANTPPIVDKTTPVDLTQGVTEKPWTQQELPFPNGKPSIAKPTLDSILPNGEGVFEYGDSLKVVNKLKKHYGIEPEVTPLGLDITGTRRVRVALRPEEAQGMMEEHPSFNFESEDQSLPPLAKQESVDLTGTATPHPEVKPVVPPQIPEPPAEVPVGVEGINQPVTEMKPVSKGKVKATSETPVKNDVELQKPRDLESDIQDYVTNPESTHDPKELAAASGIPVTKIISAREKAQSTAEKQAKLPKGVVPAEEVKPAIPGTDKDNILAGGVKGGEKSTSNKPVVVAKEGVPVPKPAKPNAKKVEFERKGGEEATEEDVRKAMKAYANKTMGYEDTAFARDLHSELRLNGKLSHQDIVRIWNENKDSYAEHDAAKIGRGNDPAKQQLDYQNRSIETLFKGLQDGAITAIPSKTLGDHFITKSHEGANELHKDWYKKTIEGQKKKKSDNVISSNDELNRESIGEGVTKADKERVARAERYNAMEVAIARKPHTMHQAWIKSAGKLLATVNGQIARLVDSPLKRELASSFKNTQEQFKTLAKERHADRLKALYKPLEERYNGYRDKLKAEVKELQDTGKVADTPAAFKKAFDSKLDLFLKTTKGEELLTQIDELKNEARDVARHRIELDEKLSDFRDKMIDINSQKERGSEELIKKPSEVEAIANKEKQDRIDFINEMVDLHVKDDQTQILENAEKILRSISTDKEIGEAADKYKTLKTPTARAQFLKKVIKDIYYKEQAKEKHAASMEMPKPIEGESIKPVAETVERNRGEAGEEKEHTTTEVEPPEVQEHIRVPSKFAKEGKVSDAEREVLERSPEYQAAREEEMLSKMSLDEQRDYWRKRDERQELAQRLQAPESDNTVFNYRTDKKGKPLNNAGNEYERFANGKENVGGTKSIHSDVIGFAKGIYDKFKLSGKIFVCSESDIRDTNLGSKFQELYDEKGNYVGINIDNGKGLSIIALNDSKIENKADLLRTISHEMGHEIMEQHYTKTDAATRTEIRNDFDNWVDKLKTRDSTTLNELYQDSTGKTWEDFKNEYKEYIDTNPEGIDVKIEMYQPLFKEYVAEQVAKYLKMREATPTGLLGRFFKSLGDALKGMFKFAAPEFIKNRVPIPSVEKWLDGVLKSERRGIKSGEQFKRKTQVEESTDKQVKHFDKLFNGDFNKGLVDGLTKIADANLAEKGILKRAINGLIRTPYWREHIREAVNNFATFTQTTSVLKHIFRGDEGSVDKYKPHIALKDIADKYNALPSTNREMINKLLIEGDKEGIEWTNKKDIKSETLKTISDSDFQVYKDVRQYTHELWQRVCSEYATTIAHTLSKDVDMRGAIKEAILDNNLTSAEDIIKFLQEHRNIKYEGLDNKISEISLNHLVEELTKTDGIKDQFKDFSRNYGEEGLKGYIPRERLEGAEWKVDLYKTNKFGEKTKVFNQTFYTKAQADKVAKDLKINPEKYFPKNFRDKQQYETFDYDNIEVNRLQNYDKFGIKDDEVIANKVDKILGELDINNKDKIISQLRQEITNQLLAQHGKRNLIARKENLIEGFSEDSPLDAIETMLNRTANSFAKMRYVRDQADYLSTVDKDVKPEVQEYVQHTLRPVDMGGKQAMLLKKGTAIWFMAFRPLTAMLQMAQLHTVGAAELGMHLKNHGINTPAQMLLAKAGKDVVFNKLNDVERQVLKIADEQGITWEQSSQTSLFSIDDRSARTILGKHLVKGVDIGMGMFRHAETYNRRAGILAAYRVFSKGSATFDKAAFDKACEYNNNTNFMLNKGNVPYWLMHNPIGMSAYSLMSYTLNMTNWIMNRMHGGLSDLGVDRNTQRKAFMQLMGYTALIAGVSGLPFADDINKLIRSIFGRDLRAESQQFLKKHTNDDITNLIADGIFAPTVGANISSNINIRIPFLSGILDDKSAAESAFGASGAMVQKVTGAVSGAWHGQWRKAAESAAPEAISGALRAHRLATEGQRNAAGQPVYFEGKQVKSTPTEAVIQGLTGIKSERRANMMETADSEQKLQQFWQNERRIAEKKAMLGDFSAVQSFNRELIHDKNARLLVNPIKKLEIQKPNKGKTAYEMNQ